MAEIAGGRSQLSSKEKTKYSLLDVNFSTGRSSSYILSNAQVMQDSKINVSLWSVNQEMVFQPARSADIQLCGIVRW